MIVIDSRDTVPQALKTLVKSNVFCAPVFDRTSGVYIGLLDMLDLVSFIVDLAEKSSSLGHDYMAYLEREELFNTQTACEVLRVSQRNKMCPVSAGSCLYDAMVIMSKNSVQRVPVMFVNQKGEFTGVMSLLTQTAVIAFLSKNIAKLGPEFSESLSALGFEPKKVICIEDHRPALEAFKLMVTHQITGLPVLDSEKKLLANISARDLRVIANDPKLFSYLHLDAGEFITLTRMSDSSLKTVHPSISCCMDEKFSRLVAKMAAAHVHRIYITDHHRIPVSVVTAHDVIKKIVSKEGGL